MLNNKLHNSSKLNFSISITNPFPWTYCFLF
jgi:hypothetical protein